MTLFAKIKNFLFITFIVLVSVGSFPTIVEAQRYSIDKAPERKLKSNIHLKALFTKNPQKKADRKNRKLQKKSSKNELKTNKKYWKKKDHPNELSTNKKVVKRMKKNLRVAKRLNHNKHKEGTVKRLSRKKIKLPKISISKIRWPWTKKVSND